MTYNNVKDYIHLANEISATGPVFTDQILVTFQAARRERSVHNTQVGQNQNVDGIFILFTNIKSSMLRSKKHACIFCMNYL